MKKPSPRVVIVLCEGLAHGGAVANVAWHQAVGLAERHPVTLISDGLSAERSGQLRQLQGGLAVQVLRVPSLKLLRRFAHFSRQLLWIVLALRSTHRELCNAPGVSPLVICHSHPLAAAVGWFFAGRVQLVMVSHGDVFHRPPGSYDPAVTWLYRRTTRAAHRRAAANVALSPVMAERIEAHGVPPERIHLIPNGLDPEEIGLTSPPQTRLEHFRERPLRLLFVGRLDGVKGVDVLLRALAITRKAEHNMSLGIIGAATESRERDLVRLTEELGIQTVVQWLGSIPRRYLAGHYTQSHMVIVPSLDDPLPTVVLEAMACGRPVIGSAVGGISFLVSEGETGLLVEPNSPHSLAQALEKAAHDSNWLVNAGEQAATRANEFNWRTTTKKLEQVLSIIP